MNNKIGIFTSARSDYGLLKNVIKETQKCFNTYLLVCGEHFVKEKGYTFNEIIKDNLISGDKIIKVDFLLANSSSYALSNSIGLGQILFSQVLERYNFNGIIVLGDRYDLFSLTIPAMLFNIPIFHISGGEITEGVIDENVRHAITKLSHLHFVANKQYANNVSQMGEEDWRIIICGECGLDNIYNNMVSIQEVNDKFGVDLKKDSFLVTYHPSTLEFNVNVEKQINVLLSSLEYFKNYELIFTAPGVEKKSDLIIKRIMNFCNNHNNAHYIPHFGSNNYLSVLKNVKSVIGNSSSGIVEACSLNTPTVNIGNRQKNRLSAKSVIHVDYDQGKIVKAIKKATSDSFQNFTKKCVNPYDPYQDGKNSERIIYAIDRFFNIFSKQKRMVKKFDTNFIKDDLNILLKGFDNE